MAQRTTGIRGVLSSSWAYDAFQNLVGARQSRRRIVSELVRPFVGQRILDVGCGTAAILEHLESVNYVGVDPNDKYIDTATRRFGDRGRFIVGTSEAVSWNEPASFDLVLALGLLHHLDDGDVQRLFADASILLVDGGRLVTVDPTFVTGQNVVARWIIKNDRGLNVRSPDVIQSLASGAFARTDIVVRTDLLRIPYTHVVLECHK